MNSKKNIERMVKNDIKKHLEKGVSEGIFPCYTLQRVKSG
jgi:hypothetical protein